MSKYSILSLLASLLFLTACNGTSNDKIASDNNWKHHSLPNGMKYHFFYKKNEPVELRLLVHTGSVQETEKQSGYAHFLEHMAFNGSKHYKGNAIVSELEKTGLEFGPDMNAFTTYDLTSYKLSLPDDAHMDKALTWFRDIGDGLNLDKTQIEAEKGVVLGEMRISRPKEEPFSEQMYHFVIKNTILDKHDVLGSEKSIKQLDPEQLTKFYRKWYIPNNSELLITGDFDLSRADKLVTTTFSSWKSRPIDHRNLSEISHLQHFPAKMFVLPQGSPSLLDLTFPAGMSYYKTLTDQRQEMLNTLINNLITRRLKNRAIEKKIEYSRIEADAANIENIQYNFIDIDFSEEKRTEIQHFLATELANLRDYGISQAELDTALAPYRTRLENIDALWKKKTSQEIIEDQEYALATNETYQSKNSYRENLHLFLKKVDIKHLNQKLKQQLSSQQHLNVFALPTEKAKKIDRDTWLENNNKEFVFTMSQSGHQLEDKKIVDRLILPKAPGKIVTANDDKKNNLYRWKLGNGIEVWLKREPKAANNIYLSYFAQGSELLLPKNLIPAMEMSYASYMRSGLCGLNAVQLNDFLTRNDTSLYPQVGFEQRGLYLTTNQKHLETAFSLLHQAATNAKLDRTQFDAVKNNLIQKREAYLHSPAGQFRVKINTAVYGKNTFYQLSTPKALQNVTADQVEKVYRLLFRHEDDFKLVIVADIAPKIITSYLKRYVANINYISGKLSTRAISLRQINENLIVPASNEDSTVYVTSFASKLPQQTDKELFSIKLLKKIIDTRMTTELREKEGLDYSPYLGFGSSKTSGITTLFFTLTINPADKSKAEKAVNTLISDLTNGITSEELATAKTQLLTEIKRDQHDVSKQLSQLTSYLSEDYDINAYTQPQNIIAQLTTKDINQTWEALTGRNAQRLNAFLVHKNSDKQIY
ncbi:M16 family metallopeptidase [Vibrio salinus]|uniref:M16 family metallopeptidase n=1 Tax=Vibrio salinus TaxID=2899784 RepID=UPI001E3D860C|nr:M16 family metallopeptidase [Vibrio salinus]MCE0492773.1 insulinase family protein [Vibrio salinus]